MYKCSPIFSSVDYAVNRFRLKKSSRRLKFFDSTPNPAKNRSMIRRFLISIACFALIDAVWLGTIAQPFYQQHLGSLLKPEFSLAPAILFYLIYLCGLNFFVIHPQRNNTYLKVFSIGAAFGACCYATFDLTSWSVFRDFPPIVALVDISWGAFLSGSIALCTLFIERRLFGRKR